MKTIPSPFSNNILTLQKRKEKLSFRKEEFEVMYHFYEENGHQFTITETDELNMQQLHNQYRAKFNLPFPNEIKAIREQYQISASKMAEVLGFGTNIYRQYEGGEVPNQSNARLIQLAKDPEEFRKLVMLSEAFNMKETTNVLNRIEDLLKQKQALKHDFDTNFEKLIFGNSFKPSSFNGFVEPNLHKTIQALVYLIEQLNPWKTGLNKLLFYTDFLHYRKHGFGITGLPYRAIQHGTVPTNYDYLLAYATEQGIVRVREKTFEDGYRGEQFFNSEEYTFNSTLFSEAEMNTLHEVVATFKGKNSSEIVNLNHEESAWKDNVEGHRVIDYGYAFGLLR